MVVLPAIPTHAAMAHLPSVQARRALGISGQVLPQAPQLVIVVSGMQTPPQMFRVAPPET